MERKKGLSRRFWQTKPATVGHRILLAALVPFSWLYGWASRSRGLFYKWGILRVWHAPVPVVSVGNLTVGGTGKTPVVDWLTAFLLNRGRTVAVVSRGHGGKPTRRVEVVCRGEGPVSDPRTCGDEPFLLARRNPRAVILTAVHRRWAIETAVNEYGAEIVVLDDGFQHLAVARDLDILLLDARRPFGNGYLLPAGPLRERPTAGRRADLLLLTHWDGNSPNRIGCGLADQKVLTCSHRLGLKAVDLEGNGVPVGDLISAPGVAFAGIADPEGFFAYLENAGFRISATVALPDHAVYDKKVMAALRRLGGQGDFYITTEKDGVKISPGSLPRPCYQIPLQVEINQEERLKKIISSLLSATEAP